MMHRIPPRTMTRQAGFSLVEALVALLVVAFGMLAVAGFQATLSYNSDVAKQRSEAVRLAGQKMEELRAFQQVASDGKTAADVGNVFDFTSDVVSNTVGENVSATYTNATNATFTRRWTVSGVGTDPQKWITVTVDWTDRNNNPQQVLLRSVIANADPVEIGTLATGPGGTRARQPRNRSLDIPYPATDLGNGTSGFTPGGVSGMFFVFNNSTGEVISRCVGSLDDFTSAVCTNYANAQYLLSGYIRFFTGNNPGVADIANPSGTTYDLSVGLRFVAPTASATAECNAQRQKVVRRNATGFELTVAATAVEGVDYPTGYNTVTSTFVAYSCVVNPVDHDGDANTAPRWSGQLVITPLSTAGSWSLGTTSSTLKVCRYTGDYDGNGSLSNREHPLYYRGVTKTTETSALDNQNYVLIKGDEICVRDSVANTATGKFSNLNTTLHQTQSVSTGTQPFGGLLSGSNSGGTTSNGGLPSGAEPSDTSVALPM